MWEFLAYISHVRFISNLKVVAYNICLQALEQKLRDSQASAAHCRRRMRSLMAQVCCLTIIGAGCMPNRQRGLFLRNQTGSVRVEQVKEVQQAGHADASRLRKEFTAVTSSWHSPDEWAALEKQLHCAQVRQRCLKFFWAGWLWWHVRNTYHVFPERKFICDERSVHLSSNQNVRA